MSLRAITLKEVIWRKSLDRRHEDRAELWGPPTFGAVEEGAEPAKKTEKC